MSVATIETSIESSSKDSDIFLEIKQQKEKLNAVILAHYYQDPDIQDIADYLGDSLQLAQIAKRTKADVILFAGVNFMAETAKILNPSKKVLVPDLEASCSLADGCPPHLLREFQNQHPNAKTISYINCSAEVKALSDIICTSSNAEKIVSSFPKEQELIFAPDKNLGAYLQKKLNRKMILWQGSCIVHETFSTRKLIDLKVRYPEAKVVAHPECESLLLDHADFIGSTKSMLNYTVSSHSSSFIIATEPGIIHEMKKRAPGKTFFEVSSQNSSCSCNECPFMKLNTIEKIYLALKKQMPEIKMSENLRLAALKPLTRMLEMS